MRLLYELSTMDSPIHRLNARSKAAVSLLFILLTFAFIDPIKLGILLLAAVLYGLIAHISPREYIGFLLALVPFGIFLTMIQIMAHWGSDPTVEIVGVAVPVEGLSIGSGIALRTLILALASALFIMTTHPSEISSALVEAGLSFRYAYMVGVALRFLPLFFDEFNRIFEAQQSRAADINRWGMISKLINMPAVMLPLTIGAVRRSGDIAIAMEMRGLSTAANYGRTPLDHQKVRTLDRIIIAAAAGIFILVIFMEHIKPRIWG